VVSVVAQIGIGFGEGFSTEFTAQTCSNLMPQMPQSAGSSSQQALFQTPGISFFATAGNGGNRGEIAIRGIPYWVSGQSLFTSNKFGDITNLGTINGTGHVSIAGNGVTIVILAPNQVGYFFDDNNGLRLIEDPVFLDFQKNRGGVFSVTYVSGFFVYSTPTEFFNGSVRTTSAGQSFNALDFASADSSPDDIVGLFSHRDELYVFSEESVQLFRTDPSTGADFPFVNIPGALIPKGLSSQHAVVEFDDRFAFLGGGFGDPVGVWIGGSGTATKISTSAIDNAIRDYTREELQQSYMSVYGEAGSIYLVLSMPRDTFVFDAVTSAMQQRPIWHTRQTGSGDRWEIGGILKAFNRNLVASAVNGQIGTLSIDERDEFGITPVREFTGAYFANQGKSFFISAIELRAEPGVGLIPGSDDGTDPLVEMFISEDGGQTFQTLGTQPLGKQGDFNRRLKWYRIGNVRETAIFRFQITSPVKVVFLTIIADIDSEMAA